VVVVLVASVLVVSVLLALVVLACVLIVLVVVAAVDASVLEVAVIWVLVAVVSISVLVALSPVVEVTMSEQKFSHCAKVGNIWDEYWLESDSALLVMHCSQTSRFSMNAESLSQSSGVFPSTCGSCAASLQSLKQTVGIFVMSALFIFWATAKSHKDMSRLLPPATGSSEDWKIE
jgi:hypothetical protein